MREEKGKEEEVKERERPWNLDHIIMTFGVIYDDLWCHNIKLI